MKRNLPIENEVFLDHVGHFVTDANAARAALKRAGFTATPFSMSSSRHFLAAVQVAAKSPPPS